MKFNPGKKILIVEFIISKEPNFRKLSKELRNYFKDNEIEGRKVSNPEFDRELTNSIVPKDPYIKGELVGGDHDDDLKRIGKKYELENFGFIYWCYGK